MHTAIDEALYIKDTVNIMIINKLPIGDGRTKVATYIVIEHINAQP